MHQWDGMKGDGGDLNVTLHAGYWMLHAT